MEDKVDPNKAYNDLCIDVSWLCGCGVEGEPFFNVYEETNVLRCKVCGPVAKMRVQLDPV